MNAYDKILRGVGHAWPEENLLDFGGDRAEVFCGNLVPFQVVLLLPFHRYREIIVGQNRH